MIPRCVFLALASLVPLVAAHGHMSGAWVDDVYVPGPEPNSGSSGFAIREINDIDPVKGTSNPDMFCGHGAQPADKVIDASPGSILKFAWISGESTTPWVHNTGPVMTYMASCGSSGCTTFNSDSAQFFKINELGKKDDGNWFMSDLNTFNGTTSATIPTNIPAGEYLVRHELIALQLGMTQGGAEFYPACLQVRVGGNNTVSAASIPSDFQTVSFPGGYSDTDPGILDPHVYDPGFSYTFPGPPVVDAATDPATTTDSPANTASDSNGTTTTTTDAPVATGCGYANKKKKRVVKRVFRRNPLVKKATTPVQKRTAEEKWQPDYKRSNHAQPVVRSRIMRGI